MHTEKALAAWGAALPDWVRVIAEHADKTSQNRVAAEIGYSPAVISYVIGNRYSGDLAAVETAVRATLLNDTVTCPVFGETSLSQCLEWRDRAEKPFRALSSLHSQMRDACKACAKGGSNDQ